MEKQQFMSFDKEGFLRRIDNIPGQKSFYYKNLVTGEVIGYNEKQLLRAASVIKLPIYGAIAREVSMGKVQWSEMLLARHADRVPPCGALYFFTDEPLVDIKTLCDLMITISDNTATNMLINRFGIDNLNSIFRDMGIKKSRVERLLYDEEGAAQGKENLVSVREMCNFLESIYRGEFVNSEISKIIEETLLEQQINHKIPGYLNGKVSVGHKTGEDDGITNDVGIVYAKKPFVIGFLSNNTDVTEFEKLIRETSLQLTSINNE